ncbi:MAG: hypothetical protein HYW48_08445 [Deltaproteobacteria bacterium]|nr:hypothetical protein [Deltaproteobacteria bacterium]
MKMQSLLFFVILYGAKMNAATWEAPFIIYEPETRKVLAHGTEVLEENGQDLVKKTTYYIGDLVGQEEYVRFKRETYTLVDYEFKDQMFGEYAKVVVKGQLAKISYKGIHDKNMRNKDLAWTPQMVSGKYIPEMIVSAWDKLMGGEYLYFDLYVPYRMDTVGFRVRKENSSDGVITFLMEASSFFIRPFAPKLRFTFESTAMRRLLRYQGPSIVAIDGKKDLEVVVEFDYPVTGQNSP